MSWYDDFKAKPAIKTDEGIKSKSKRGEFVKNWWATRWLASMERLMDRGRLQRGRTYARAGQVLSVEEKTGGIVARVQGSRSKPYKITIQVEPLTGVGWERVLAALAERPIFVAQLLAGEMPREIEEAFTAAGVSLFPEKARDLKQECSCPDYVSVCKHLAAVHYILAERFDEDPFLLFRLCGKSQDEILAALSRQSGVGDVGDGAQPEDSRPAPPLSESLDTFWQIGPEVEHFTTRIIPPETPYPILARLGPPGFLEEIHRWLGPAYDTISEAAVATAFATETQDELEAES
jgi:uncharacterized Zn finger protein